MPTPDFEASWERTRGHLARAWVSLPVGAIPERYSEYLDANELELAMQVLAEAGDDHPASPGFWSALADAADEMGLTTAALDYRTRSDDKV